MNKVVMELRNKRYYHIISSNNYHLWILAAFLKIDVCGNESFLNWAKDQYKSQYGGNIGILNKIKKDVILHLEIDDEDYENNPAEYSLTISITRFIFLLEKWHEITHDETPYIIIFQEKNGEIEIFASDTNPESVIS